MIASERRRTEAERAMRKISYDEDDDKSEDDVGNEGNR